MSDGLSDGLKYHFIRTGTPMIDSDPWDDKEMKKFAEDLGNWLIKEVKCECGAHSTYGKKISDTMHATYCPLKKEFE